MRTGFGDRLRAMRKLHGYSQSELAKRLSVPPSSISHFESERRLPSYINLFIIGKRMGWSIDKLMGLENIKPEDVDTFNLGGKLLKIADILNEN